MPSRWQLRVSKLPVLEGTVKDCFTELRSNVPSFLDHKNLLNRNSSFFRKCTQDTSDGEIDFSEN